MANRNVHLRVISFGAKNRLFCTKINSNLKNEAYIDKIGPPDPLSNLRPISFGRIKKENNLEKRYREVREETQRWNQDFWAKHNVRFIKERKQFQESLKANGKESLTADDMSVFYKQFLDKNWDTHFRYNLSWYKRNLKLLFLEIGVRISRLKFR